MALAISFVSEDKNTFVVAFDGKPQISEVVETIKDKMNEEGVMSITDWHIGVNIALDHEYVRELTKAISRID
jgi:hypothetical protein